jgi:hypothetical protein
MADCNEGVKNAFTEGTAGIIYIHRTESLAKKELHQIIHSN